MTHFICGVIVPREEIDFAEEYISETLEKYSEDYEVEPYIQETKENLEKGFEKWKEEKKQKLADPSIKLEDYELEYVENGKLKEISIKDWLKSWHDYGDDKFDKEGNLLSTSNPNSFFDWYVVGGRWDGLFYEDYESKNATGGGGELKNNIIPIKDLIKKYKNKEEELNNKKEKILRALSNEEQEDNPYLIRHIVVNGGVYQSREMGWFGTYNEKIGENDWKEEYLKLLEEYQNDFMINLDCHC